ncbi:MarR family winged helix-turn-helix transcriptional regulator [Cryptosporangium phraense]|uniref:Winged helix-turn-helix transcriptional regulator n=1 Tax=Cryptosporangium phraense TaxID=2593070 RepID=A0A545AW65_9ACTN|nr:helix-turn-helix domain-containing protein [Cryptosporangium phraense]TQS45567.1 winged helix-turn-helix transcriptional regulator [Cryptosporangium phraense]
MSSEETAPTAVASLSGELAAHLHDVSRQLRAAAHAEVNLVPLPDSERDVLRFVAGHPGASVSAVGRELRMKSSNVSAAVRSLVARGLMIRAADPNDRRIARLTLTDQAHCDLERLQHSWDAHLDAALSRLEPGYRESLEGAVPALRALVQALRER